MKHSKIFLTILVLGIAAGWPKSDAAPIGFGIPTYYGSYYFGNPYGSPLAYTGNTIVSPLDLAPPKPRELYAVQLPDGRLAQMTFHVPPPDPLAPKVPIPFDQWAKPKPRELHGVQLPDGRPANMAFHVPPPPPPGPLDPKVPIPLDPWASIPIETVVTTPPKPRELYGVQLPDGRPAQMTFHAPPPDPLAPKGPIGPLVPILFDPAISFQPRGLRGARVDEKMTYQAPPPVPLDLRGPGSFTLWADDKPEPEVPPPPRTSLEVPSVPKA